MAVSTQQTLRMVFRNQAGNNVTFTLDNPRDNLTTADIEAVMDLILARNIFTSTGGDLVAKQDARIIDTSTNDLYDPVP